MMTIPLRDPKVRGVKKKERKEDEVGGRKEERMKGKNEREDTRKAFRMDYQLEADTLCLIHAIKAYPQETKKK